MVPSLGKSFLELIYIISKFVKRVEVSWSQAISSCEQDGQLHEELCKLDCRLELLNMHCG